MAKAVKTLVDEKVRYTDWHNRLDIQMELKMDLIVLLDAHDYPPSTQDEVYREIFEQAENFGRYRG